MRTNLKRHRLENPKFLTATKKEASQCYQHKVTLPVEAINIVTTGLGN